MPASKFNSNWQTIATQMATTGGTLWLSVSPWARLDWLWHGFSTRCGGVSDVYLDPQAQPASLELNLGYTSHDTRENVLENRSRFIEAVTGSRETPLLLVQQVHSCLTLVADKPTLRQAEAVASTPPQLAQADGLITQQSGVLIGVQTADCIPVLVADPARRVVAAFHAGWRGTVQRIVELGIARMATEFSSDPATLLAAIGPGIGPCCYTVGQELRQQFGENFTYAHRLFTSDAEADTAPTMRLDLVEANRRQLLDAGLSGESIATVGACTACHPNLFYSHRASAGRAGRMMAVIGIR
jgi:YfiH family protein